MIKQFVIRLATLALVALPLSACGSEVEHGEAEQGEGEHDEAEAPEGPHGGRLLKDGDLGLEITIFEAGQEPSFRVYPYWKGAELEPGKVRLQMTLTRLGGKVDRFSFAKKDDFLAGQGVVREPHSFDVEVVAVVNGKRSRWTYENHEGRGSRRRQPNKAESRLGLPAPQ